MGIKDNWRNGLRDFFLMLLPVGWSIVCFAAMIACAFRGLLSILRSFSSLGLSLGLADAARSRAVPSISAAGSGIVAVVLAVDWWLSHRKTFHTSEFKPHSLTIVRVKLVVAVILLLLATVATIYFIANEEYRADLVWTGA